MKFKVVACGVNIGPGAETLSYAENDAYDFARHFYSAAGPLTAQTESVQLLLGADAKQSVILAHLALLIKARLDYLVFYFSGHGSNHSILASDKELRFADLAKWLKLVNARRTLIVLDVCHAGSFRRYYKEAKENPPVYVRENWAEVLALSTPGSRLMLASSASQSAHESKDCGGGFFTRSLLEAFARCEGDINLKESSWISEELAFAYAENRTIEWSEGAQEPVGMRLDGTMPLALPQASEPIGRARLKITSVSGEFRLSVSVRNREGLRTKLTVCMFGPGGRVFLQETYTLTPGDSEAVYTHLLEVDSEEVEDKLATSVSWLIYERVRLHWFAQLADENGNELAREIFPIIWSR